MGLTMTEVYEVASEFGKPESGPLGVRLGALRIECGSGIAGRGEIWAITFPGHPQLRAVTGIETEAVLRGTLRWAWRTVNSLSGRESMTLAERVDLLAAEIVQLQAVAPTGCGHDVHQFNQMLGNMQGCVWDCRKQPVDPRSWGFRNLSATELRVMAWRRGGVEAYDAETERLYPRRRTVR